MWLEQIKYTKAEKQINDCDNNVVGGNDVNDVLGYGSSSGGHNSWLILHIFWMDT